MVVVGVFLPWFDFGFATVSGWLGITMSVTDAMNAFLVFIGGMLMLVFAMPAFVVSMVSRDNRKVVIILIRFAIASALCALGGSIWLIVQAVQEGDFGMISYGFWIGMIAAIIGLVFAILTVIFSRSRDN
jgi:hypothetical protein